ncbi:MAG: hypothetical protein DBX55_08850 [Verrucomicrobia bacterium]|nr:MAG: hypothetical protein DBX55_08850 [Verrucomicrobiota bacterium]
MGAFARGVALKFFRANARFTSRFPNPTSPFFNARSNSKKAANMSGEWSRIFLVLTYIINIDNCGDAPVPVCGFFGRRFLQFQFKVCAKRRRKNPACKKV